MPSSPFVIQDICDGSRLTLNDANKVRYPDAELFVYCLEALSAFCLIRPDLFMVIGNIPLVAGCEQVLPSGGIFLAEIHSIANGIAVTETDIDTLAQFNPNWRTDTAGPTQNWFRHPKSKLQQRGPYFGVYPAAIAGATLTGEYCQDPNPGGLIISSPIGIPDSYYPPFVAYVIYRAETKDDQHVVSQRAAMFKQIFAQFAMQGQETETEDADTPQGKAP